MQAAGVDVCSSGWVAVVLCDGRFDRCAHAAAFSELLEALGDVSIVGVDVPIGLPDLGARQADIEARRFVGPRRASVFPTPTRAAVLADTYADARRLSPSLSAQSFALAPRILEVEDCLDDRIFEVHPEVSFAALAGRHLAHRKRSWNGHMERRHLLVDAGIALPDYLPAAGRVAADDVLDAAVAAWSASRMALGFARSLPVAPPMQTGRAVAIWY